jgi:type III pantothenate kinase
MMSAKVSQEGVGCPSKMLLADVGNSRTKLALLSGVSQGIPLLERRCDLDSGDFNCDDLENWLMAVVPDSATLYIASVYDAAATQLETVISSVSTTRRLLVQRQRVRFSDFPLGVRTDRPDRVGIDRLAAATAASRLVLPKNGCVVIDCGTAATIDMVSADRQFLGGAILPGPALLARSLADGTSLLPEVSSLGRGAAPPMPGRSTNSAIAAGVGFGIRGAVSRLVEEALRELGSEAEIILTGGWRGVVRGEISNAREFPDLVLSGIGIAAMRISGL